MHLPIQKRAYDGRIPILSGLYASIMYSKSHRSLRNKPSKPQQIQTHEEPKQRTKNITVHLASRERIAVMTNYMGNNASRNRASHAADRGPNLEAAYSNGQEMR